MTVHKIEGLQFKRLYGKTMLYEEDFQKSLFCEKNPYGIQKEIKEETVNFRVTLYLRTDIYSEIMRNMRE